MSYWKNWVATVALVFWVALVTCPLWGQELDASLEGAARRFASEERRISGQQDYWEARDRLAQQALRLAEKDLKSRDAEALLQWVLASPRSSPAAMQASKYLAEHHSASQATIDWMLNRQPREWTPALFARLLEAEQPPQVRVHLELSKALHDRELLLLSDEMKAASGGLEAYEQRLGKSLTEELLRLDDRKWMGELVLLFKRLAGEQGDRVVGGASIRDLADGAIFSMEHLRLGATATGLAGRSVSGKEIDLADYRGQVVLVDFWATWCAPCVGAMPQLKQLQAKYKGDPFQLIGVSADEDPLALKKFMAEQSIDWPTLEDGSGKLQKRWMSLSLPTYYVLDQAHVVRYRGTNLGQAVQVIEGILGKDEVASLVRLTLQTLDKNGDQKIEKAEFPADKQGIFAASDLDKDGFWSVDELTKFTKANMSKSQADASSGD